MATLGKHVLGIPKGTVGDSITFSTWKGKAVVRSKAMSVSDPNTEEQQAVRNKFRLLGQTLVPLSDIIGIGWSAYAKSGVKACTAQNAYTKYHLKEVPESDLFNGEYPDYESINADKLLVARGALNGPSSGQYVGGRITFSFSEDYEKDNVVYAVLYNPGAQEAVYASAVTDSTSITINLQGKDNWEGETLMYYFVTNAEGKKASNSTAVQVSL